MLGAARLNGDVYAMEWNNNEYSDWTRSTSMASSTSMDYSSEFTFDSFGNGESLMPLYPSLETWGRADYVLPAEQLVFADDTMKYPLQEQVSQEAAKRSHIADDFGVSDLSQVDLPSGVSHVDETAATLPSRGSKNHGRGQCRPCRLNITPGGCQDGDACNFCHYNHSGKKLLESELFSAKTRNKRRSKKDQIPAEVFPMTVWSPGAAVAGMQKAVPAHEPMYLSLPPHSSAIPSFSF